MDFKIERKRILLAPQNVLDEAYIEDTLGLREDGDYILLKRKDSLSEKGMFELETKKKNEI
jgi:hypothetical protein